MIGNKDKLILETLKEDARLSSQAISKLTGIPITTVHYRLKNLKKQGVIKGQTIKIDHKKVGKEFLVYVVVFLDIKEIRKKGIFQEDVVKKFLKFKAVEKATITVGEGSCILRVRVSDKEEYSKFLLEELQQVDGVDDTKSLIALKEFGD